MSSLLYSGTRYASRTPGRLALESGQVRRVLATYCSGPGIEIAEVPADLAEGGSGLTPVEAVSVG